MAKMVILAYNQYSFTDKESGRVIEGIKAEAVINYKETNANKKGMFPVKYDVTEDVLPMLNDVPAMYDVETLMVPAGNRSTKNVIVNAKLIKKLDFFV